jgi:long-chain acyl-CoA synthetase
VPFDGARADEQPGPDFRVRQPLPDQGGDLRLLIGGPRAVPDGWLRTGDLATGDAEGYYTIVDRKKEMVIRGGFNIYPREIEEALYEHASLAEAAVIGLKHLELGEEVGAAVVLEPGAAAEPAELRAFVKARVAAYKYPRHVWLAESLPKGPTGKILRREVQPPPDLVH